MLQTAKQTVRGKKLRIWHPPSLPSPRLFLGQGRFGARVGLYVACLSKSSRLYLPLTNRQLLLSKFGFKNVPFVLLQLKNFQLKKREEEKEKKGGE